MNSAHLKTKCHFFSAFFIFFAPGISLDSVANVNIKLKLKEEQDMTLIKRKGTLLPEFPGIFDNFFGRDMFDFNDAGVAMPGSAAPAVNVREHEDGFEVEVAAPGFNKKDFHVEVENDLLTISSVKETKDEESKDTGRYTRREFGYTSFKRSFALPENTVNTEKIKARYEEGILHISIPKLEEVKPKPAKAIAIS